MGRITALSLLGTICFISAAYGLDYDDEAEPTYNWPSSHNEELSPTAIIIIITVILLIKGAIICCCCLCCPASPIYRWCHRNNSTSVTVIQPTSSYPAHMGQNNFSFAIPPQPAMLQDPPPQYNREGYSKLETPRSDFKSGYDQ